MDEFTFSCEMPFLRVAVTSPNAVDALLSVLAKSGFHRGIVASVILMEDGMRELVELDDEQDVIGQWEGLVAAAKSYNAAVKRETPA